MSLDPPPTPVDPKRTGVPATRITWTEPPVVLYDGRWYGPPGAMIPRVDHASGLNFLICCPGCGQLGTARDGAKWRVVAGTEEDVSTLTVEPSILKNCCGWHGYLRHGVFESC